MAVERRGERVVLIRRRQAAHRRRQAERRHGVPAAAALLLLRRRRQPLDLHRQAGAQVVEAALGGGVRVRLRLRLAGAGGHRLVDARVLAVVDHVEHRRVLVGALHLLRRHASLRVAVGATVVTPWVLGSKNLFLPILSPAMAIIYRWILHPSRRAHPNLMPLLLRRRLPLLGGLERQVGDVAEGAGSRRVEVTGGDSGGGALAVAVEVAGPDHADGALGDGEDLRGQVLAEVGGAGATQVSLQLPHELLDVAQLRHHQPPSSIALHALHHPSTLDRSLPALTNLDKLLAS